MGTQPAAPPELAEVGPVAPQRVDLRFVDREEEFADVFFRPTVKRERDGESSPPEPQQQVRREEIYLLCA